jgi:hypothetical protein
VTEEYDYDRIGVVNFDKWPFENFTVKNPKPALIDACKVLDKLKVDYCLAFGVALGFHRQNDFIPYDADIDIAVKLDVKDKKKCKKIADKMWDAFHNAYFRPLRITYFKGDVTLIMQLGVLNETKVPIDIFFFYENIEEKYVVHYDDQGIIRFKKEHLNNIKKVKFKHGTFPMPTPTDDFLEFYYGKDWRTPTGKKEKHWHDESKGGAIEMKDTPWSKGNEEWYSRFKHNRSAKKHRSIK